MTSQTMASRGCDGKAHMILGEPRGDMGEQGEFGRNFDSRRMRGISQAKGKMEDCPDRKINRKK